MTPTPTTPRFKSFFYPEVIFRLHLISGVNL